MIDHLEVELVSPAIIGGATPGHCDRPLALRPPELRGLFRFWTRALGGTDFRRLEEELWGSTRMGQRVTVRATSIGTPSLQNHALFPHKSGGGQTATDMVAPKARFHLQFRIPRLETSSLRERLQAVVWTALHLGAVGRRSRRGYGSLQWAPKPGDLLTGFLEGGFDPGRDLQSDGTLAQYLERGLRRVGAILGRPAGGARTPSDWFELQTVDQVFVGRAHSASFDGMRNGMEEIIHGCGPFDARSTNVAERRQLGGATSAEGGRLASPMLWHVHRLENGQYVPVMTWSPRQGVTALTANTNMHDYLTQKLGFGKSLANFDL